MRQDDATVEIELLRPAWWVEQLGLEVGVMARAKYPELELDGLATVLAIEPTPPIAEGPGAPVIGKFTTHNATALVRLQFVDGGELTGTQRRVAPVACNRWVYEKHLFQDHIGSLSQAPINS